MERFLLDTNVVSELRKIGAGKANRQLAEWSRRVNAGDLYLSVITLQELEVGVRLMERRDAGQGAVLRRWLDERLMPAFDQRILPVTAEIARLSAAHHVPSPRSFQDSLIAATAQPHGMTMVTRNIADFAALGCRLLNPFER